MQIEFYFSDSNLPGDKFLRQKVKDDTDGFVDIALLCSFSKMRAILGITADSEETKDAIEPVAEVLRTSSDLVGQPPFLPLPMYIIPAPGSSLARQPDFCTTHARRLTSLRPLDGNDALRYLTWSLLLAVPQVHPFRHNARLALPQSLTAVPRSAAPHPCPTLRRH